MVDLFIVIYAERCCRPTDLGHYALWKVSRTITEDCERSAESGCNLCLLLLQTARWGQYTQKVRFTGFRLSMFRGLQEFDSLQVCLDGLFGHTMGTERTIVKITGHVFEGRNSKSEHAVANVNTESPAAKLFSCRPIMTDVIGDTACAYIRSWLSQCFFSHVCCMRQASAPLPPRLIDVGLDRNDARVKLHIAESDAQFGSYAALSYCWGGDQHFKALKSSIEKLKSGFVVATLPQTIQDAIEVTRKIGLRFLWIDALCIIQDCAKDEHNQIQNMGSIFKNATLTIAATVASSVTEGFLRVERQPPKSYLYDLPMEGGTTEKILLSTLHIWGKAEPLDTRGWAFQERLLSPRLLQFTGMELAWTCQTEPFKTFSGGEAYCPPNYDPRLPSQIFFHHTFTEKSRTTRQQRVELWKHIVDKYSQRRLTYTDDRPLTLFSIVTELQKIWKDEYVHGLWRECMIPFLAWVTYFTSEGDQRSSRAPSWSWQSLDCGINFQSVDMEDADVISIVSASMGSQARISLACKILDEETIPKDERIYNRFDIDGNEYPHKKIFYLMLGHSRERYCRGLMIVNVSNALFRRVGFFRTAPETEELWNTYQRQTIFLE